MNVICSSIMVMEDEENLREGGLGRLDQDCGNGRGSVNFHDDTVREVRVSSKQKHTSVKVTEDLLNRRIQVYGLVTPERSKNVVLCGPSSRNTLPTMSDVPESFPKNPIIQSL